MTSRCATFLCSLIKTGALLGPIALAAIPAAPALAGVNDPLQVLYIFPGARDDGGSDGAGVATLIHCFNFIATRETVQFTARNFDGSLKANLSFQVDFLGTRTAATHDTNLYAEDLFLHTGVLDQGAIGVAGTSTNIVCTGQVVDAAATVPNGFDLHAVRFNPIAGNQE